MKRPWAPALIILAAVLSLACGIHIPQCVKDGTCLPKQCPERSFWCSEQGGGCLPVGTACGPYVPPPITCPAGEAPVQLPGSTNWTCAKVAPPTTTLPAPPPTTQPPVTQPPAPLCVDPGEHLAEVKVPSSQVTQQAVDAAVAVVQAFNPGLFAGDRLVNWPSDGQKQNAAVAPFFAAVIVRLNQQGYCAWNGGDALLVQNLGGFVEEFHLVNFATGHVGKANETWRHTFQRTENHQPPPATVPPDPVNPPPDPGACPLDPSRDVRLVVALKSGAAGARWLDVTAEYFYGVNPDGTNAGPCGDPTTHQPRRWCPLGVDGGPNGVACETALAGPPVFSGPDSLRFNRDFRDNPYLAQVIGSGTARVCSSVRTAVCTDVVIP